MWWGAGGSRPPFAADVLEHVVSFAVLVPGRVQMVQRVLALAADCLDAAAKYGMVANEMYALSLYTHDSGAGLQHGEFYFELNTAMRAYPHATPEERCRIIGDWAPYVRWLMSAFGKLPSIPGCFYRGRPIQSDEMTRTFTVGRRVTFAAVTSLSMSREAAADMASDDGLVMEIQAVSGAKAISEFSFFPYEMEMLLPPLTSLVVISPPGTVLHGSKTVRHVALVEVVGDEVLS